MQEGGGEGRGGGRVCADGRMKRGRGCDGEAEGGGRLLYLSWFVMCFCAAGGRQGGI